MVRFLQLEGFLSQHVLEPPEIGRAPQFLLCDLLVSERLGAKGVRFVAEFLGLVVPAFALQALGTGQVLIDVLARPLDVQRQFQAAQTELDNARAAEQPDPAELSRLFGEQGQLYFAYSFEEAARACFVNAQKLSAEDHRWAYYLGRLLRQAGDAEASRTQFERALALDPAYRPTSIALAELHIETNRLEEAEHLADGAVLFGFGHPWLIRSGPRGRRA